MNASGTSPFAILQSALGRLNARIERHLVVLLGAMTLWFAFMLVVRALTKSFWHDEVYTALLSRLPLVTLWRANLDGADLTAQLNTQLTHFVQMMTGPGLVATRLPPMVGFLAASMLLGLTVAKRTNVTVGLLAPLILYTTPAVDYAVEARGYALSVGFFALALYAWTEAAAGRRPALHWTVMSLALTAGVWTHYYLVLAFLPIVIGEFVRQKGLTKFQIAPWTALACAGLGILPLSPLIAASSAHRTTFWAQIGQQGLATAYGYVVKDLPTHTFLIAVLIVLAVAGLVHRTFTRQSTPIRRRLAGHDLAACIVCLALPAAGILLGHVIHVFTARYLVFATAGVAFAAPLLIWRLMPENRLGELLAVLALAWPIAMSTYCVIHQPPVFYGDMDEHPVLADWLRGPNMIVITGGVDYLGLWYSIPEEERAHAIYLADPEAQFEADHTDTVDEGYLALARWTAFKAVKVEQYTRAHRRFWLYSYRPPDRLIPRLTSMGASVVERVREPQGGHEGLFEVSFPDAPK